MNPLRWYPHALEPVRFDEGAAAAARSACRAAIEDLMETQRQRQDQAARARTEWRGPHREAFDDHTAVLERRASGLINALQDLITAIDRADMAAAEENDQRARARAARRAYDEDVRRIGEVHAS